MSIQNIVKILKTVKRTPSPSTTLFLNAYEKTPQLSSLSGLNPTTLHQILSDPFARPMKCMQLFNFILENQTSISFKPDLQAHLTLIDKLLSGRRFSEVENLLKSLSVDEDIRYPFSVLASTIEKCCCFQEKVVAKLFNLMLKVYSDCKKFDLVCEAFDHMKKNGIQIDERTCTVHLLALMRNEQINLGLEFFNRMIESGIEVSAYSLTVVVDGLCKNGDISRCRELVEEMVRKGIKPNIVTYNTMLSACAKRWNFSELDLVLLMIDREAFNDNTYKILIDGYSSFGKIEEAEKLLLEMHDRDLAVDTHIYNLIIKGYCKAGFMDKAVLLLDKMILRGISSNADTYWPLINGFCKVGKMEVSMVYISKMQSDGIELDQDIFNMLIEGYCNKGMVHEAFNLQIEMERRGYYADVSVCSNIARGLCESKRFEEAKMLMNLMVKRGGSSEIPSYVTSN